MEGRIPSPGSAWGQRTRTTFGRRFPMSGPEDARTLWRITPVVRWAALLTFIAALAYLTVFPLVRLQIQAFSSGLGNYRAARSEPEIGAAVRDTVIVGIGSLVISVVIGTGLAW